LRLSSSDSHSPIRSWISVWKAFDVFPSPRMVRTIWVAATAQSFSVSCEAKTVAGSSTTRTSTAVRTSGVGVGLGVAEGASVAVGLGV
jgi:hypothetical protein